MISVLLVCCFLLREERMAAGAVESLDFEKINNGRTRFRGVEGALTMNDAIAIRGVAESICAPAGGAMRYAEIGSYLGLSATIVADACPGAIVFAHDVFPMAAAELPADSHPPPGAEKLLVRFWEGVRRNGLEGRVVPMRGRSEDTLQVHEAGSLDMAFIDGDHSHGGTLLDLRAVWERLRPGGLLLVHDAVVLEDGATDHPVRQAVKAFAAEQSARFFDVEYTWGLVAIPKDGGEGAGVAVQQRGSADVAFH